MRAGEVGLQAGYDGEYGVVRMFDEEERLRLLAQTAFSFGGMAVAPAEKPKAEPALRPPSEEIPTDSATGPNLEQDAAIAHGEGPLLIVAGPGTGKTPQAWWNELRAWYTAAPPRRMGHHGHHFHAQGSDRVARAPRQAAGRAHRRRFGADLPRARARSAARRMPLPRGCRRTSRFSTRRLGKHCSLRCTRRRASARYRSRGPRTPSRRPRPRWSRQQMQHPNWRQSTVRMRRRSPARARLTSTIWWLVPSACWKRTKLRSPPRTVAVATCWWTSIRISMRPNTVWCVCWPPRVLQRICARLAIPIRRSTVFAGPILCHSAVSPATILEPAR